MQKGHWIAAALLLALSGCYESMSVRGDAGHDAGTPPPPPADDLDLLFVVDSSGSMTEEQASFTRELPRLIGALATGDLDGDGFAEARAFRSIQVGVVTTDMGTGGFVLPTCTNSDFGDDGILQTDGNVAITGCMGSYPPILSWSGSEPSDVFAQDFSCVAAVGTGGCGFEQQLEAPLKALTPTVPQTWTSADFIPIGTGGAPNGLDRPFFMNSQPHGDRENAGFARNDSLLAIVIVTDEEDCSAWDENLFDPSGGPYAGVDLNLRCFSFPEAQHPIERYVAGFIQLRRHWSRLAYFVLAGIPVDLVPAPGEPINWPILVSPDPALRDDRMEERVDTTMRNRLVPSCNVPDRGVAFAPVRMVRVAEQLQASGARVGVGSICQDSYASPMRQLALLLTF